MSLVPFATRIATVRVLQEALPATVFVADSPQEPLDLLDKVDPKPIVAVYTGNNLTVYKEGRNFLGGRPYIHLNIQILLPETFVFSYNENREIVIDTRRQGAETAMDVLWRQCVLGLTKSQQPWALLWRNLIDNLVQIRNASYLIEREGVRAVAREITIDCEPLHEPVPGGAPSDVWAQFLALVRADENEDGLSSLGDWIEAEIRGGEDLPQSTRDAAYMGLSTYVAQKIRVEPVIEDVGLMPLEPAVEEYADASSTDPQS